jgi:hypothetical protein
MSSFNPGPKSRKFMAHRSILIAEESPLSRLPGCSGGCSPRCPESCSGDCSTRYPERNLENYLNCYSLSYSASNLASHPGNYRDGGCRGCSSDSSENRPGSSWESSGAVCPFGCSERDPVISPEDSCGDCSPCCPSRALGGCGPCETAGLDGRERQDAAPVLSSFGPNYFAVCIL